MQPAADGDRNRTYRVLLVIGALLFVGYILWSVRSALLPFAIGALIAYLLAPLVNRFESWMPRKLSEDARRLLAVIWVYLLFAGVLVIGVVLLVPPIVDETEQFVDEVPNYWDGAREELDYWNRRYEREVPADVREELEANFDEVRTYLGSAGARFASTTFGTVRRFLGFLTGLVLLPLWLFYVLKDQRRGLQYFYGLWPVEVRDDVREVLRIIDRVLAAYIRAQLFLGIVIGVVTGIGLWLIGVQQPVALGVVAGILEMVPILGPWISFVVAAVVVLATDPGKIIWVAILFLGVQQLENTFLVPRVQGSAVNINPAVIMILLVIGGALWGIIGVIVIVPLAAIARDIFVYVYRRLQYPEVEDESTLSPAGPAQPPD
jgi:predicted PurR-regulated permease PerM